jgi:hypothetical protein
LSKLKVGCKKNKVLKLGGGGGGGEEEKEEGDL